MKIENPVAFRFIMQDDIYLLNNDKALYANSDAQPVIAAQPVSFNYLGGNKKKFLVVVHYPELEFIADNHLTALQNIFKRMELGMDDVAIFNKAAYNDATVGDLFHFFGPQKLLLLGRQALPEGIEKLTLNVPAMLNDRTALFSFSFDEMMDNTENKKAFWEQVKQL